MNVLVAWVVCFVMCFAVTVGWYASAPAVMQLIDVAQAWPGQDARVLNAYTVLGYVHMWMPVIFCLAFIMWAFAYSQKRDPESYWYE